MKSQKNLSSADTPNAALLCGDNPEHLWEDALARRDAILANISGARVRKDQPVRSIADFGALGDGASDCRLAFDRAMKAASESPSGLHLTVPAGDWFIKGPIRLVSRLTLELQEGARLLFSPEPSDYLPVVKTSWEGAFCQNLSPMLYGFQLEDVAIVGRGTIDGNCADTFPAWRPFQGPAKASLRDQVHRDVPVEERAYGLEDKLRPHLLQFFACRNITVEDVLVTKSPFWCVHFVKCENVVCRRLRFDAKLINNDGIDPEMSRDVLIEDVTFDNGDDNVAIKAGRDNDGWRNNSASGDPLYDPWPAENIVIRRCSFKGLHGLAIGSEMSAGVRNVFVEDCTYGGPTREAVFIKANPNRGGFMHEFYFRNCEFGEVDYLFRITGKYAGEGADDHHFTSIHSIHAQNVHARKAVRVGIALEGTPAEPIHDVSFDNVSVDEAASGFAAADTRDVVLRNCRLGDWIA